MLDKRTAYRTVLSVIKGDGCSLGEGTMKKSDRNSEGFSLIELLIVVAIILIIAAVAIPSLIGAKSSANQLSAIQSLRAINQAETLYNNTYQTYSTTLAQLGPATGSQPSVSAAGLINDTALIAGTKAGYVFKYTPTGAGASGGGSNSENNAGGTGNTSGASATVLGYTVNADPLVPGKTGTAHYFLDESGSIHVNNTGPASATDPTQGG
jgi:prepilin-type N-terminal cleavage/methylation domain-containing protein